MHACSLLYHDNRCCTYDNRGIGNSSIPPRYAAYRTRHMAADAVALMGHLGWERAHVLGMSLGGTSLFHFFPLELTRALF
jgi:pimeloyl-ACP methyl ester carboxylesterase